MTATGVVSPPVPAIAQEPLFRSAHQAMLFAFTYADANGHPVAAAAERAIALQSRERYERPYGSQPSRGLRGQDGAAQAGMIQEMVLRERPPQEQFAIIARFRILRGVERDAACTALALYARRHPGLSYAVRDRPRALQMLIRRHFGIKVDMGRLADYEQVDARTVRRWQVEIKKWIVAIERRAVDEAEGVLKQAGVVE